MPKPTLQQQLDGLLKKLWPEMAQAFREAVAEIRSRITLKVLVDRLTAGDINGALESLHIDRAAFYPLEQALTLAYQSGGTVTAQNLPVLRDQTGARVVIRFDLRNPPVEARLAEQSSRLITGIVDDQRESARVALTEGMAAGQNPKTTALSIVGRVNRATGQREGGILGLTQQQAAAAGNLKDAILSGDPKRMRAAVASNPKGKRFDVRLNSKILQAADTKSPVSPEIAQAALTSYRNKALKYRGDLIGKNETFEAIATSKDAAYDQAIQSGKVKAEDVEITWKHFPSEHPRHNHEAMHNKVIKFGQVFILPDGTMMRYPHDPAGGIRNNGGCHCQGDYRINFFEGRA